jgi:subtilisin family serine protease
MIRARVLAAVLAVGVAAGGALVGAVPASAAPGPPPAPEWWFDSWNVTGLWGAGADGRGITIAVIDTGVAASRPELQGKILPGADFIGNGSDGRIDYDGDEFSHGTAMSSIMVASKGEGDVEGLAPGAKILPISVPLKGVTRNGTPPDNPTAGAIDYAVTHGAKIISMSLGGVREESEDGPDPCPALVQRAVLGAVRKGALVVAASGNSGDADSPVEEPGVCLGVTSVGAVDQALNVTSFSSRHPYLTVSAPGDKIPSLSRDSVYIGEGTSQATALTSASLAVVWSKYPKESGRQILTRLLSTVTDRGPKGRDSSYGFGVINPQAAIAAASPSASAANAVLDGVRPLLAAESGTLKQATALPIAGAASPTLGSYRLGSYPNTVAGAVVALGVAALVLALLAVLALIWLIRRKPTALLAQPVPQFGTQFAPATQPIAPIPAATEPMAPAAQPPAAEPPPASPPNQSG